MPEERKDTTLKWQDIKGYEEFYQVSDCGDIRVRYSRERMKKPRRFYPKTNTGEKYIRKQKNRFYLEISQFGISESFTTLGDAVKRRESILRDQKEYFAR